MLYLLGFRISYFVGKKLERGTINFWCLGCTILILFSRDHRIKVSLAILSHFVWISKKITIVHIFFLIFVDFSMFCVSLSSIKSTWQQWHLCTTSKQKCYWFANCIHVNNTKCLTRIGAERLILTFPSTFLPGGSFSQKSFILAYIPSSSLFCHLLH